MNQFTEFFTKANTLNKLIIINVAIFVLLQFADMVSWLFIGGDWGYVLVQYLAVPAHIKELLFKFWTPVTYMFLHYDFWHILFNMLWLYWFGQIFMLYLTERQLLSIYILGGLSGALLYILFFNTFPVFEQMLTASIALGASASVMAVVVAIAVYKPNHIIPLIFLGQVKIKYIAIFSIVLDVLQIRSENSGGHIAHIGGAILGFWFAAQFIKRKDITTGFSKFLEWLFSIFVPQRKLKVTYKSKNPINDFDYNKQKKGEQEKINQILDKISKSGYDSLSKDEKETLFKAGGK